MSQNDGSLEAQIMAIRDQLRSEVGDMPISVDGSISVQMNMGLAGSGGFGYDPNRSEWVIEHTIFQKDGYPRNSQYEDYKWRLCVTDADFGRALEKFVQAARGRINTTKALVESDREWAKNVGRAVVVDAAGLSYYIPDDDSRPSGRKLAMLSQGARGVAIKHEPGLMILEFETANGRVHVYAHRWKFDRCIISHQQPSADHVCITHVNFDGIPRVIDNDAR